MSKNFLFALLFIIFFISSYYCRLWNQPLYIPFLLTILLLPFSFKINNKNTYFLLFVFFITAIVTSIASYNALHSDDTTVFKVLISYIFVIALLLFLNLGMSSAWFDVRGFFIISLRAFLLVLTTILLLGVLIKTHTSGFMKLRLNGGVNSNFLGFFALSIIFFSVVSMTFLGNRRIIFQNIAFGFIVLMWSMSRASIAVLIIACMMFLITHLYRALLLGVVSKTRLKRLLLFIVFILTLVILLVSIFYEDVFMILEYRLSAQNVSSRGDAWAVLYSYYEKSPVFGYIGWYGSTVLLSGLDGATSAHSLYFRLLSEVGIIGFTAVLSVPIFLILYSLIMMFKSFNNKKDFNFYLVIFIGLIGVFLREFLENSYLKSYMELTTFLVIFSAIIMFNYKKLVRR